MDNEEKKIKTKQNKTKQSTYDGGGWVELETEEGYRGKNNASKKRIQTRLAEGVLSGAGIEVGPGDRCKVRHKFKT